MQFRSLNGIFSRFKTNPTFTEIVTAEKKVRFLIEKTRPRRLRGHVLTV